MTKLSSLFEPLLNQEFSFFECDNTTRRLCLYVKESGSNEKTKYYIGNIPNYLQIWASNKELFYHKWSLHIFEPFKSSIFSYRMTLFLFKQNAWTQKYLQLYNTSEILKSNILMFFRIANFYCKTKLQVRDHVGQKKTIWRNTTMFNYKSGFWNRKKHSRKTFCCS